MSRVTVSSLCAVARFGRWLQPVSLASLFLAASLSFGQSGYDVAMLKQLSLEELMQTEISTLSGRNQTWWEAPGAIDVIRQEDIRRSPARSLPDILRLATGVHVAQSSELSWAVGIRGFNVLAGNKMSVEMDGRSLFTPFFSGVNWDVQDTLLADIDQVEVVRGPVGSLWGAFAVNGFIQITTKPAWETQGWYTRVGTGTEDPFFASSRFGGRISDRTYYRVYLKYRQMDWTYSPDGSQVFDTTDFVQTGFRIDSSLPGDTVLTFQGDVYTNKGTPRDQVQTNVSGGNLLARWSRETSDTGKLELEAYFDHTDRSIVSSFSERRDTGAFSAQYSHEGSRQAIIFGADVNISKDKIDSPQFSVIHPPSRTIHNYSAFVQHTWHLVPDRLSLSSGIKAEDQSLSGMEWSPSLRAAWTPHYNTTVWTGVSRAVRPPVRVDEDLRIGLGDFLIVDAHDNFGTEEVIAFEAGVRHRLSENLFFDVAAFYNDYDHLRSSEPLGSDPLPLTFKNNLNATSHGVEVTVNYQPTARIQFKLSYRHLHLRFSNDPGSVRAAGVEAEGNDPEHLAILATRFDLPWQLELDTFLRHVSELPDPATPSYTAFDFRLAWHPSPFWSYALSGRNLLDHRHPELATTNSLNDEVAREITIDVTFRY